MRFGVTVAAAAVVCGLGMAGCAGGVVDGGSGAGTSGAQAGAKLTGVVHGGQNPIAGAQVYLLAAASGAGGAGQAAYGGAGIAASAANASVSLLTNGLNTLITPVGEPLSGDYYVTTGPDGSFSISGDYSCAAGQQVYLYALGGDPGLGTGTNAAAGLMAVLGNCNASGKFQLGQYIVVNEVSTVAAAYAMAGFATDSTHVGSSGTALALMGIANAFANAGNLETLGTGVALAVTPAGNGTVPQAEINTLANVLASCVNSNGTGTACATLFANAESGGTTGTVATDTASAAINIAHNPGAGVAALYGLASGTPPFGGGLTGVPNDWTVAISFTGNGLSYPFGIAIDGAGNAWVASAGDNSICEMSSSGAPLSGANGYAASGLNFPRYIAIDPSGDAWVAGNTQPDVVEVSGKGATLSGSSGYTGFDQVGDNAVIGATGIAIDGSGNVWVPDSSSNYELSEFANNGSFVGWISAHQFAISYPYGVAVDASGNAWITDLYGQSLGVFSSAAFTGYSYGTGYTVYGPLGGLDDERNIAIDGSGDVWVTNAVGNSVSEISKNGAAVSGAGGYTGTGLANPNAIAIDGAGDVWVTNATANSVVKLSNSGAVLTGASGYLSGNSNPLSTLAVDGSGDLWVVVDAGNSVEEAVGAATPVVTPLSVGVENNMLGTRP